MSVKTTTDTDEREDTDEAALRQYGTLARGVVKHQRREHQQARARRSGQVRRWVAYTDDDD